MDASTTERNMPKQVCTTCNKPTTTSNSPRCMLCGAPTHAGCSTAGFCKADIDKLWSRGGEQFLGIERGIKKAKLTTKIAVLSGLGGIYAAFILFLFGDDLGLPIVLAVDDMMLYLVFLISPVFVLMWIQFRSKNKVTTSILARDSIIRDMRVDLKYEPRKSYNTRSITPFTYTCSSCHGPMHVEHTSCLLCYKALCSKCDEGGLCPAHAAALSTEEKEQLSKSGDLVSSMMRYMLPIIVIMWVFMGLILTFDLPLTFIVLPLAISILGMYKLFSIMRIRQRLRNRADPQERQGQLKPL
jgi:hypothetical protein